jgi:hypothetical protein
VSEGDAGAAVQRSREEELSEHPVDAVDGLVDILEDEDRAAEVEGEGRTAERRDQREVPASQPSVRTAAANDPGIGRDAARVCLCDDGPFERVAREGGKRLPCGRRVEGNEIAPRRQGRVQRRNVGKPEERLRRACERAEIDVGEETHGAVASAQAPDAIDAGIGERGHEIA